MSDQISAPTPEGSFFSPSNARLVAAETHMRTPPPEISAADAEAFTLQHYGLHVIAQVLTGERDKNFLVSDDAGWSAVLKFYNSAEDAATRALQHGALLHIHARDPLCPVPEVYRSLDGAHEVTASCNGLPVAAVLIERIAGDNPTSADLAKPLRLSLGDGIGRLMAALADYKHPRADRALLWDTMLLGELAPLLAFVEDAALRRSLETWLSHHICAVEPAVAPLPHQVIHNDLSMSNVLVKASDRHRLSGIIDFGDCVRAPRINELAIAASYFIGPEDDLAGGVAELVRGLDRHVSLSEAELALLPDLLRSRLAARILLAGWRAMLFPENSDYLLRSISAAIAYWDRCISLSSGELMAQVTTLLTQKG